MCRAGRRAIRSSSDPLRAFGADGHGRLSEVLLEHNLLDELKIWIHSLLMDRAELRLGEGKKARLKLVATRTLKTGVIVATYRPAQL
jgi:hypothetical protein